MFVAVAQIPATAGALKRAAEVTGLALPDVSQKLAGILPRVLVRASSEAQEIAGRLEESGFTAFTGEASAAPGDGDRVVARDLEFTDHGFVAVDGRGQRHECPAGTIVLFQRGTRMTVTSETIKTKERRFDAGRAILTGGLMLTKKVETTAVKATSAKEPFVLVRRSDDKPEVIFYEHRCSYRCLGEGMQPMAFANLMALLGRLRALAPDVPVDERVMRPGFLAGLPELGVDSTDFGLYLVALAYACGKVAP